VWLVIKQKKKKVHMCLGYTVLLW